MNYRYLLTKYIAGIIKSEGNDFAEKCCPTTKEEDETLKVVVEDANNFLTGTKYLMPPPEHEEKLWHLLRSNSQYLGEIESRWLWTGNDWMGTVWQPPTRSWVRMGPWTPEEMAESHSYIGPTDPPICKCSANDLMRDKHAEDCPAFRIARIVPEAPSEEVVAQRLGNLTPDKMPWLRGDVDLTPPDGGPETCGDRSTHDPQ